MFDPLDDLAALARALERRITIFRDVWDLQPDDTWQVTESLYRGWVIASPQSDEKGEPDV